MGPRWLDISSAWGQADFYGVGLSAGPPVCRLLRRVASRRLQGRAKWAGPPKGFYSSYLFFLLSTSSSSSRRPRLRCRPSRLQPPPAAGGAHTASPPRPPRSAPHRRSTAAPDLPLSPSRPPSPASSRTLALRSCRRRAHRTHPYPHPKTLSSIPHLRR
jgi:hypothetical protein